MKSPSASRETGMLQLSVEEVRLLAHTFGLTPFDDEIEEIAIRLNALFQATAPLEGLDLGSAETIPTLPEGEL
jgi:hypothetical protein